MRELWVQGVCIWGLSSALIMSMEGSQSVTLWEYQEGKAGGESSEGGSSAEQTHGVVILVGMAFFFAWRRLGITTVFLTELL